MQNNRVTLLKPGRHTKEEVLTLIGGDCVSNMKEALQ